MKKNKFILSVLYYYRYHYLLLFRSNIKYISYTSYPVLKRFYRYKTITRMHNEYLRNKPSVFDPFFLPTFSYLPHIYNN